MADRIEDGGPAFPRADQPLPNGRWQYGSTGMSLRDWFAGQILPGLLDDPNRTEEVAAKIAYATADAMLSARQKGGA